MCKILNSIIIKSSIYTNEREASPGLVLGKMLTILLPIISVLLELKRAPISENIATAFAMIMYFVVFVFVTSACG